MFDDSSRSGLLPAFVLALNCHFVLQNLSIFLISLWIWGFVGKTFASLRGLFWYNIYCPKVCLASLKISICHFNSIIIGRLDICLKDRSFFSPFATPVFTSLWQFFLCLKDRSFSLLLLLLFTSLWQFFLRFKLSQVIFLSFTVTISQYFMIYLATDTDYRLPFSVSFSINCAKQFEIIKRFCFIFIFDFDFDFDFDFNINVRTGRRNDAYGRRMACKLGHRRRSPYEEENPYPTLLIHCIHRRLRPTVAAAIVVYSAPHSHPDVFSLTPFVKGDLQKGAHKDEMVCSTLKNKKLIKRIWDSQRSPRPSSILTFRGGGASSRLDPTQGWACVPVYTSLILFYNLASDGLDLLYDRTWDGLDEHLFGGDKLGAVIEGNYNLIIFFWVVEEQHR